MIRIFSKLGNWADRQDITVKYHKYCTQYIHRFIRVFGNHINIVTIIQNSYKWESGYYYQYPFTYDIQVQLLYNTMYSEALQGIGFPVFHINSFERDNVDIIMEYTYPIDKDQYTNAPLSWMLRSYHYPFEVVNALTPYIRNYYNKYITQ